MAMKRASLVCGRESAFKGRIPTIRYEKRPCNRCGETCIVTMGSVKVIKDHNAEVICNECYPAAMEQKLAANELPIPVVTQEQAEELRQIAENYRNRN